MMISFAIVNWEGGDVFKRCIASIVSEAERGNISYEIVIVDNASDPASLEFLKEYHNIKLIINTSNYGFAKGTNQSISNSKGNILFILNNDVVLQENCTEILLNELKREDVGIVVPQIQYFDGTIQRSIRGIPFLMDLFYASVALNKIHKFFDHWFMGYFDYSKKQEVEQPMFSALLLKRHVWEKVGKLDGQFPLLFNDVDWFFRFSKLNGRCMYIPEAKVFHIHGMSVNKKKFKKILESTVSMYRYFKKNHRLNIVLHFILILLCVFTFCLRLIREYWRGFFQ